jgi:tRNA pseudouridine55 synthase
MNSFRGFINQVPPMFSAKKQKGEKLYELARRGQTVDRMPVRVCIHEFAAIKPGGVLVKDNLDGTYDFEVRIVCSSGTYIRTLAEDFGRRAGIGAHLAELRRTRVGNMTLAESLTLEQVKARVDEAGVGTLLVDPNTALSWLPFVHLSEEDERRVRHGMEIRTKGENFAEGDRVRLCDVNGDLLAIGEFETGTSSLHPRVVLTEEVKAARS